MINITKQILEQLFQSPSVKLFFTYHFDIVESKSMIPVFADSKIHFPSKIILKPKTLTEQDKLDYYIKDLELYLKRLSIEDKKEV